MDELRTMGRLRRRYAGAREAVNMELRRAGYDPATLDALPEDVDPDSPLGQAIAQWREADRALTAGETRSPARR